MFHEQHASLLLFLLISGCSAAPNVRTFLEVRSPGLQNYWEEAKECRHFVHYRLDKDDDDLYNTASSAHDLSVPFMLSSTNWPTDQAKKIWDEKAHCVFHILIINASPRMTLQIAIETFDSHKYIPEYEYYFAVTKCHSCTTKNYEWLYSEFSKHPGQFRGQSFRPFMVVIEYDFRSGHIERIHNFWLYCHSDFMCVTSFHVSSSHEDAIYSQIAYSFPQSVSQMMINYKQWPIYLWGVLGYKVTSSLISDATTTEYRNFFVNDGPLFALPMAKVALEVSGYLNATLEACNWDIADNNPITVISMAVTSKLVHFWNAATIETTTVNFMYCLNDTSSDSANVLLIFKPFDQWVWLLLLTSVTLLLIILRRIVNNFPCFKVLRCLLDPGKFPRGKTMLLFLLWTSACALLATLYACFIQSLMVVPTPYKPLTSFQELSQAGYRIVFPKNTLWRIGLQGEYDNLNWFGLDLTVDRIESKESSPGFWEHFLRNDKRVFVSYASVIHFLTIKMDNLLTEEKCFAGEKRFPWFYDCWVNNPVNSAYVNLLFQKLNSGGILQLYREAATKRESRFTVDSYIRATKTGISTRKNRNNVVSPESMDTSLKIENMKMILAYFGIGILMSLLAHAGLYMYRLLPQFLSLYHYFAAMFLMFFGWLE